MTETCNLKTEDHDTITFQVGELRQWNNPIALQNYSSLYCLA